MEKKEIKINFNSVEQIKKHLNFDKERYSVNYNSSSFCDSWTETIKQLEKGFNMTKEIILKVEKINKEFATIEKEILTPDVEGLFFDVGAYCSGDPEHWLNMRPIETKVKKNLKIYINNTQHGGISKNQIINRGAVLLKIIELLQENYNLELVFYLCSDWNKKKIFFLYEYKIIDNIYSRDLISFLCCSPGLIRRIFFNIMETERKRNQCGSYGTPFSMSCKDADIHIDRITGGEYSNIEESISKIKTIVKDYMI